MEVPENLENRLAHLLRHDDRPSTERRQLIRLMSLLASLPSPPLVAEVFPSYPHLHQRFLAAMLADDPETLEERFLELYAHLHMHQAPYLPNERQRLDETGGYWSHAGGLSPILKAGPWLGADSVSADLGAGNGLQSLLMLKLYPHRRTIQVEISSRMVEIGVQLQRWLGLGSELVEWIVGDVCSFVPEGVHFLYLYRPLRPEGPGAHFYRRLSDALERSSHPVVVFSVADCLGSFLPACFVRFYDDGHLTCYRKLADPDSNTHIVQQLGANLSG